MTDKINMTLSTQLAKLTSRRKITIVQLSKNTGISPQTLHNWLSGAKPRNLIQVKKVALFFNLTVDALCFGNN